MILRIGDRDPITGLYNVIWPDDSQLLNGVKIFNAAHQTGDIVLGTHRSDGMMILNSAKADTNLSYNEIVRQPVGYLQGQVFNNDEEDLYIVSIVGDRIVTRYEQLSFRLFISKVINKDITVTVSGDLTFFAFGIEFHPSSQPNIYTIAASNNRFNPIGVTVKSRFALVEKFLTITIAVESLHFKANPRSILLKMLPMRFFWAIYKWDLSDPIVRDNTAIHAQPPPATVIDTQFDLLETHSAIADYEQAWLAAIALDGTYLDRDAAFFFSNSYGTYNNSVHNYPVAGASALLSGLNHDGQQSLGSFATVGALPAKGSQTRHILLRNDEFDELSRHINYAQIQRGTSFIIYRRSEQFLTYVGTNPLLPAV